MNSFREIEFWSGVRAIERLPFGLFKFIYGDLNPVFGLYY